MTGIAASTGSLTGTDAQDAAAFVGSIAASGSLSGTEAPDALAFEGNGGEVSGTLDATEPVDMASMTASLVIRGVMGEPFSCDTDGTTCDTGSVTWDEIGTPLVESPDTLSMTGEVGDGGAISGTLAATEDPDTFTASGTFPVVETPRSRGGGGGYVTWTEPVEPIEGQFAATETPDTVEMVGAVANLAIAGTLAATERSDRVLAFGNVSTKGGLWIVEAPDGASFAGKVGMRPDWARYDEDLLMLAA